MVTEKLLHAITKHVMGDCSEFTALRNRFKDFDACTGQPAAAALGYLIAKDELEAKKEEEEEEEPDVYDEVVKLIEDHGHHLTALSAHTISDIIFTSIYCWLQESLTQKGYYPTALFRRDLEEIFRPFVIDIRPQKSKQ
jgi:hypothetical protein